MRLVVLLFAFSLTLSAQSKPTTDNGSSDLSPGHLPVHRVVLYKNGVGYFEHTGHVRGNQEVNIDFTTGQLNDVLKSLTVVDLGEGRVTGVRYNSIAPLNERLRGLRLPLGAKPTREELLNALLGARVEVRNGSTSATGKILSVETSKRENSRTDETVDVSFLSVVTDAGEIRTFELNPATSVRIVERDLSQELNRYFTMVGSSRAKDVRRMTISTSGTGERDMLVSYVSEVPVWKTTYRIVIPPDPKRQPLLQGWAVVDNTVGEDWKDVKLSLVAGAPQSFIQQISTPLYARRPVVGLPETAQISPQTHEGALEEEKDNQLATATPAPPPPPSSAASPSAGLTQWEEMGLSSRADRFRNRLSGCDVAGTVSDPSGAAISGATVTVTGRNGTRQAASDYQGNFCFNGIGTGNAKVRVDSQGFKSMEIAGVQVRPGGVRLAPTLQVGTVSEMVEVSASAVTVDTNAPINGRNVMSLSPGIAAGARNTIMEQQFQSAAGREIGELFSYDIKQPITIGKDQSALVPIVQSRIESQKVTIWNDQDVPRRALWIRNTSGATLDSGSFSIVEGDSFAGEGLLDPIKPDEKRLLSYAADQSVRVKSQDEYQDQPISHVRILRGVMTTTRQSRSKRIYEIHNIDKEERHVVIEHPARPGWTLTGAAKPQETTASLHRFLVDVKPGETAKLDVEEFHPEVSTIMLSNLNSDMIVLYSQQRVLSPETEKAFRAILDQKGVIANFDWQLSSKQQEMNNISNDQARVRENMKALKGSAEEKALVQRYATQMNQQEDRIATLRTEMDSLRGKRDEANQQLDKMLMDVSVDEDFGK